MLVRGGYSVDAVVVEYTCGFGNVICDFFGKESVGEPGGEEDFGN